MFGLGFGELIILGIIVLIFIGPDRLPSVMKTIGKFMRDLTQVKDEWQETVEQDPNLKNIRDSVEGIQKSVHDKMKDIQSDLIPSEDDKK